MNYFEHNDQHLQAIRRIAAANHADRARMLATIHERDMGCVTLYMDKWTQRDLLVQAGIMHVYGPGAAGVRSR